MRKWLYGWHVDAKWGRRGRLRARNLYAKKHLYRGFFYGTVHLVFVGAKVMYWKHLDVLVWTCPQNLPLKRLLDRLQNLLTGRVWLDFNTSKQIKERLSKSRF